MKAVVLAAAILSLASFAQAKDCPSIYSKGYGFVTSGDVWTNDAGATMRYVGDKLTVSGAHGTKSFEQDVWADELNSSVELNGHEAVIRPQKATGDYVSPDLAKWTGGSPTFVRTCK